MAVTKKAVSKASAQIFLEWALSHEGQVAIGKSGLTPYRADVKKEEVPFLTYTSIVEKIGENKRHQDPLRPGDGDRERVVLARWKKALQL